MHGRLAEWITAVNTDLDGARRLGNRQAEARMLRSKSAAFDKMERYEESVACNALAPTVGV